MLVVVGGVLAYQFRKRQKRAYGVSEIIFAVAANWAALNKLGQDLQKQREAQAQEQQSARHIPLQAFWWRCLLVQGSI
jgi:hypothetical protein